MMNLVKMLRVILPITFFFWAIAPAKAQKGFDELMAAGIELHDAGKYEDAIEKFELALKMEPKSSYAHYEMANSYVSMQKYEKAIKHADKAIEAKDKNAGGAYVLKGTAYDLMKKPQKAIDAYQAGIKTLPNFYLLHYNLAITQVGIKEFDNAEASLIKAITYKVDHPGSHYALGVVQWQQGRKVKALLPLYNFLILEPKSQRSVNALKIIDEVIGKSAQKKANGFDMTITLDSKSKDDSFAATDLFFGLSRASIMSSSKAELDTLGIKSNNALNGFIQTNEHLFKYLGESNKEKPDFWWTFYAAFFADMEKAGFTETFSYAIRQSTKAAEVKKWMGSNEAALEKWIAWLSEYERKVK